MCDWSIQDHLYTRIVRAGGYLVDVVRTLAAQAQGSWLQFPMTAGFHLPLFHFITLNVAVLDRNWMLFCCIFDHTTMCKALYCPKCIWALFLMTVQHNSVLIVVMQSNMWGINIQFLSRVARNVSLFPAEAWCCTVEQLSTCHTLSH